jgi:hypothetical protein
MRCIRSLRRSSFMSRKLLKSSKSDQKLVCLNMLISVCLRTAKKAKRISTKRCWIQLKTWFRVLGKCCKRRLTLWTEKMKWKHHEKLSFWVRCLDCLGIRGLSLTGMFSSLGMFWRRVITELLSQLANAYNALRQWSQWVGRMTLSISRVQNELM